MWILRSLIDLIVSRECRESGDTSNLLFRLQKLYIGPLRTDLVSKDLKNRGRSVDGVLFIEANFQS